MIKKRQQICYYLDTKKNEDIDLNKLNDRFYNMYFGNNIKKMGYPLEKVDTDLFELMSIGNRPFKFKNSINTQKINPENMIANPFKKLQISLN